LYKKIKLIVMQQYKITQIKSGIDRPARQKRTLVALGITRMNRPVVVEGTPQIMGMINKVQHLVKVEEL
jgi:large subunit ribosomal protein L30